MGEGEGGGGVGNIDRREFLAYSLVGFGKASAVMAGTDR